MLKSFIQGGPVPGAPPPPHFAGYETDYVKSVTAEKHAVSRGLKSK